jgi:glutathione S-transferase
MPNDGDGIRSSNMDAMTMKPVLYVGNINYSSWSLRPFLALRWAGIDFDMVEVELDQPGYGECAIAEILAFNPAGKVPALRIGDAVIADSLAICEWASETGTSLYPQDALARALVRSVIAEMHSGFAAVRRDLSMNIRRRCKAFGLPADTLRDIARLDALFSGHRRHAVVGPFLFGQRTLADAFFTPVATRFRTYGILLSADAQAYCDTLLGDAAFLEWERMVLAQPAKSFSRANIDGLYA